jgi:hypothetical protein
MPLASENFERDGTPKDHISVYARGWKKLCRLKRTVIDEDLEAIDEFLR